MKNKYTFIYTIISCDTQQKEIFIETGSNIDILKNNITDNIKNIIKKHFNVNDIYICEILIEENGKYFDCDEQSFYIKDNYEIEWY